MLPAFVLFHFDPLTVLGAWLLSHAVWFVPLVFVAVVLVVGPIKILAFLRTPVGLGLAFGLTVGCAVWVGRGTLDQSIELRTRLEAERVAAAAKIAAADLARSKAEAAAVEARRQAEAQRAVAAAAAKNEAAARAEAADLEEQAEDFADRLTPTGGCILSAAGAASLAGIGAKHHAH